MAAAAKGDKSAVDFLHKNRQFIDAFLLEAAPSARGKAPAALNRTKVLEMSFAALYENPRFRLFLSSMALRQEGAWGSREGKPPLAALRDRMEEKGSLEGADMRLLIEAERLLHSFLFDLNVDVEGISSNYSKELASIAYTGSRKLEGPAISYPGSILIARMNADKTQFDRMLGNFINADILTATALYLRRWQLRHPQRGGMKEDSEVPVWRPPKETDYDQATEIFGPAPKASGARKREGVDIGALVQGTPKVAVIGASVCASGVIGKELEAQLQAQYPGAKVSTHATGGHDIRNMIKRFRGQEYWVRNRDGTDGKAKESKPMSQMGYNVLAISGTARWNDTRPHDAVVKDFETLIKLAQASGMSIILFGAVPSAYYTDKRGGRRQWSRGMLENAARFNEWAREYARTHAGVRFVDVSAIGESSGINRSGTENYPQFKRMYDGDGLHPNRAGQTEMGRLIAAQAFQAEGQAVAAPQTSAAVRASLASPRIAIVGDSIMAHSAVRDELLARTRDRGGRAYQFAAVSASTRQIRGAYDKNVKGKKAYNVVVIQGGTNDLGPYGKAETAIGNLRYMVEDARREGKTVILCTIAPWEGHQLFRGHKDKARRMTEEINRWIRGQANPAMGVFVVDLDPVLGQGSPPRIKDEYLMKQTSGSYAGQYDYIHPNEKGRRAISDAIYEQVFLSTRQAVPQRQRPKEQPKAREGSGARERPKRSETKPRATGSTPVSVSAALKDAAAKGDMQAMVDATQGRAPAQSQLDDAFDSLVMDMVKKDASFQQFLRKNQSNLLLQAPNYKRNASTRSTFRPFYAKAVREYINSRAKERGGERLKEDLAALCHALFKRPYEILPAGKDTVDLELVAAIALYNWRGTNTRKPGAEWAYETKVMERKREEEGAGASRIKI